MFSARYKAIYMMLALLTSYAPITLAEALPTACDDARTLVPTDVQRHTEGAVGETHCYRLSLPASGLVHLSLSSTGWETARARLRFFDTDVASRRPKVFGRFVSELLLFVEPGTWWLEVAAEDPRDPLPAYRLASRFLELGPDRPERKDGENEGELEPDPETFSTDSTLREALCGNGDDHGDSFVCATDFYGESPGQLGNHWGDDTDLFRFRLLGYRTLVIASQGEADTYGELYDRNGQRLAGADDGGDGDNFRLVRTLAPGEYFVRVGGRDSVGEYRLLAGDVGR